MELTSLPPNFVLLPGAGEDGADLALNLSFVRIIEQTESGVCLRFSEKDSMDFTGPAAKALLAWVELHCICLDIEALATGLPEKVQ